MKALLITGEPGSGKSAVLARVVTLSALAYRQRTERAGALRDVSAETLPPVGSVACAVWARAKTVEVLLGELHEGLFGEPPAEAANLIDLLAARLRQLDAPPVVALDALDEAVEPAVVANALEKLCRDGLVRLLITSRRPWPDALEALAPKVIDLDAPEFVAEVDLLGYAARILTEISPDANPARRLDLARAIEQRAGRSFLVARILAESVALEAGVPAPAEFKLPATLGAAIDGDLGRRLAQDPANPLDRRQAVQLARDLLRPLAYARGDGLPLAQVWAAVATAIAWRDYADADIEAQLAHLRPYLTETPRATGSPSFRLDHELVVRHFRETAGLDDAEVERHITQALLDLLPVAPSGQPDWLHQPPTAALNYARAHVATHAAAGPSPDAAALLEQLLSDPAYLVAADPAALLPQLQAATSVGARAAAHVYRRTAQKLPRVPVTRQTAGEPAAYLELRARQEGYGSLADTLAAAPLGQPWHAPFAAWEPSSSHGTVVGHLGPVLGVGCLALRDGTAVAATAGSDGTVAVWDLHTGEQRHRLEGHARNVYGVACLALPDGTALAVTGGLDGTVRVWDLHTGEQLHRLECDARPVQAVACLALPDGTALAVTGGGQKGMVRVWDLHTGELLRRLEGHNGWVFAVGCIAPPDGTAIAATGGRYGTVRVWDLHTGEQLHRLEGHTRPVRAVACLALPDGTALAATGGQKGTVRVWNLATGRQLHRLEGHAVPVTGIACLTLGDGTPIAATTDAGGAVRVWDPTTGKPHSGATGPLVIDLGACANGVAGLPGGGIMVATDRGVVQLTIEAAPAERPAEAD